MWDDLGDNRSRIAVEVAEAVADGSGDSGEMARAAEAARAAQEELAAAFVEALTAARGKWRRHVKEAVRRADAAAVAAWAADATPLGFMGSTTVSDTAYFYDDTRSILLVLQGNLELIREVYFCPPAPPCVDPVWLKWTGGTVVALAGQIDGTRQFDELPVLADALEEAGCGHEAFLAHLRSPGPHVRGCWALDLILGKE